MEEISEKEFAVIREISCSHLPDQRTIALKTGISLGLTNLIIKRLIKKGYVKARQLNQKKIQYLLTPKGFSEKADKSYKYTLRTINLVKSVRESIQELILRLYDEGHRSFIICGAGDIAGITEIAFRSLGKPDIVLAHRESPGGGETAVLIMPGDGGKETSVDIVAHLSETGVFIN